jgi:hypothetical protein
LFALVCNQCNKVSQIPEIDGYHELTTGPAAAPSTWHFCGWECLKIWTAAVVLPQGGTSR